IYQQLLAPLVQQATAQLTTALVTRVSTLGQGKPQFPIGSGSPDPGMIAQPNPALASPTQISQSVGQILTAAPVPVADPSARPGSSTYFPPASVHPPSTNP